MHRTCTFPRESSRRCSSGSGVVVFFFFGYNWEWGPAVGGIEANIDSADIRSTSIGGVGVTFPFDKELKTDGLASVRARLGYLVLPNLLLYGTGGIGYDHSSLSLIPTNASSIGDTANVNEVGWVAGAGAEYKIWQHVLLRAEYLHYDFGKSTASASLQGLNFTSPPGAEFTTNIAIDHSIDVVMGGIAYKF